MARTRDACDACYPPVLSEKSAQAIEDGNVYTFIVNRNANKIEIAQAIEKLWDVKVDQVRTMRYAGKAKRALMGRMSRNPNYGRRPAFKKAVVQLAADDHIEFYEVG